MRFIVPVICLIALLSGSTLYAYDGEVHDQITASAIETFKYCLKYEPDLQSEYGDIDEDLKEAIIRKNRHEDGTIAAPFSLIVRYANWHFYNKEKMPEPWLMKRFFDRIFKNRNDKLEDALEDRKPLEDIYVKAASVMHYIQDVSSVPHAAAVYHYWFLGMGIKERFDDFKLEKLSYPSSTDLPEEQCRGLLKGETDAQSLVEDDATATLKILDQNILPRNESGGQQYKWSAFWRLKGSSEFECEDRSVNKHKLGFGTYGQFCNNFGEPVVKSNDGKEFRIEQGIYEDLFLKQFVQARDSSVKFLAWVMRQDSARE